MCISSQKGTHIISKIKIINACAGVNQILEYTGRWHINRYTDRWHLSINHATKHPLDYEWWLDADEPWMFLAFCFEWSDYKQDQGDHWTHLPIFVDGKANGSQHMAALMRCKETGKLVGLCPVGEDTRPEDLYGEVAKVVNQMIDADAANPKAAGHADAIRIREIENAGCGAGEEPPKKPFRVDRRMAKTPVMTYGYGVTDRGMRDGLSDAFYQWHKDGDISKKQWAILCPKRDPEEKAEGAGPFWRTIVYLVDRFEQAIEQVAIATGQVMHWLKESAHVLAAKEVKKKSGKVERIGLPIAWTTPIGFPVYFAKYGNSKVKLLKCRIYPRATAMRKKAENKKQTIQVSRTYPDRKKIALAAMKRGVPPDVIHSFDAAHMMKTIDYCQSRGIRSFAMIHDSYGTHAPSMPNMALELRRAFIDIYKNVDIKWVARNLIQGANNLDLRSDDLGDLTLPEIGITGTLDIADVIDATYFFA